MKGRFLLAMVFVLSLFVFAALTTKFGFHDSGEYLPLIKEFGGFGNASTITIHSLVYPFFLGQFSTLFHSLVFTKLVNTIWLILIGFLLFFMFKNFRAFLIWIFSPLVWYMSININPVLPASFFVFLAYFFFKKWEKNNRFLLYSGISLGLSCAFYTPSLIISSLFIFIFFFDKKVKSLFFYLLSLFIGFLPRLLLDYYLFSFTLHNESFGFPFYSLVRYVGSNFLIFLGLFPNQAGLHFFSLFFIVIISPLLFMLFKFNFKNYKKELLFSLVLIPIFIFRGKTVEYFLFISPLLVLLLSKVLSRRMIVLHVLSSILVVVLLITSFSFFSSLDPVPFFGETSDYRLSKDIEQVSKDYDLVLADTPLDYSSAYWGSDAPYFYSLEAYLLEKNNMNFFVEHSLDVDARFDTLKLLSFSINLESKETPDNLPLVVHKASLEGNNKDFFDKLLENYDEEKCYDVLCVYSPKQGADFDIGLLPS